MVIEPRDLRRDLEQAERQIRREEKQKVNQPRKKKFTADAYLAYTRQPKG